MQVVRRLYIYLVSYISLVVMLIGAWNLLSIGVSFALGLGGNPGGPESGMRERLSVNGAFLLVGGIVFGIHWFLAQRSLSPGNPAAAEERRSVLRHLMIYGALATASWQIYFAAVGLIQVLMGFARYGNSAKALEPVTGWGGFGWLYQRNVPDVLSEVLPVLLIYGIVWYYFWRVRSADAAITHDEGRTGEIRSLYFYLASFAALTVLLVQLSNLLARIWILGRAQGLSFSLPGDTLTTDIIQYMGWILVSAVGWAAFWIPTQRLVLASGAERHSNVRRIYLYVTILTGIGVLLAFGSMSVYNLLSYWLGGGITLGFQGDIWDRAGESGIAALIFAASWAYHRRVLGWDVSLLAAEPERQESLLRVYHYLVAFVGLGVFAAGVADLFYLVLDLALGGSRSAGLTSHGWGDSWSLVIVLLAAGLPLWAYSWWRMQWGRDLVAMSADRRSLARRVYLYATVFVGVVALLFGVSAVLYGLLNDLGRVSTAVLVSDLSLQLGISIAGAAVLAYHLRLLLADQRVTAAEKALEAQLPETPVSGPVGLGTNTLLLISSADAAAAKAALERLQVELPETADIDIFRGIDVSSAELTSWLASREPKSVGPADSASVPEQGDHRIAETQRT